MYKIKGSNVTTLDSIEIKTTQNTPGEKFKNY